MHMAETDLMCVTLSSEFLQSYVAKNTASNCRILDNYVVLNEIL